MSRKYAEKSKLLFLAQNNGVDFVFYDLFCELCKLKGVSVTKATVEIGLSRTIGTKWKRTGATPNGETLNKIADYFGVSVDYLLGQETEKAPTQEGERQISDDDIKFALFGGDGEITDAMYEEVKRFAHMVKLREEAEKKKE